LHPDQLRPKYESEKNRAEEAQVAGFLQNLFGWTDWVRTEPMTVYDYDLLINEQPARLEIKVRETMYDSLMLSTRKVEALLRYREQGYIPVLAVRWKDKREIGVWCPLRREHLIPCGRGGRVDRNDERDVEDVYALPLRNSARYPYY
jgi:hypothetical protein